MKEYNQLYFGKVRYYGVSVFVKQTGEKIGFIRFEIDGAKFEPTSALHAMALPVSYLVEIFTKFEQLKSSKEMINTAFNA